MTTPTPAPPPRVSILLVTHNHLGFIDRAIASIDAQAVSFPVEVVVADDASSDGTRERLEAWAHESPHDVRVLPAHERLGITLNYARGFRACRGDYVAVLEGDDEWLSVDKVRLQAEYLDAHPESPLVATRILLYGEESGSAVVIPAIGFAAMTTQVDVRRLAEANWFATFSCCMYRTRALEAIPPEVFEATSYDWMVNLAVLEHGPAGFLPQVLTLYRQHAGGEWSRARQVERDLLIRDLLPSYIEMATPAIRSELTRTLHELEGRLRSAALAPTAAQSAVTVPDRAASALPIPRVVDARAPQVSVVMTCYNHAAWVEEAVTSVLEQTFGDLELIIVDDGSSDASLEVIARFTDPRVRAYRLETNQGAAAALNLAIQQTRGELVAVINSDDAWEPRKLERQLAAFAGSPELGAVFTGARFVGTSGEPLAPDEIPRWYDIFRQPNRSQAQWLRHFFQNGNVLCHPSVLVRRRFYEERGLYDNRMRQLPDLERWVDLVKHWPIEVIPEDLVRFRVLPEERNASSTSRANVTRGFHEHLVVDARFFEDVSDRMLVEGFGDLLIDPHFGSPEQRACEIALLWWSAPGAMQELNRVHSVRLLRELLGDDNTALILRARYNFRDLDLHALAGQVGGFGDFASTFGTVEGAPTGALLGVILHRLRRTPVGTWPGKAVRQLRLVRPR